MSESQLKLPSGWALARLEDVCEPVETVRPDLSPATPLTYIDISSIERATKTIERPQELLGRDAPARARQLVRAGDVLMSTVRPNLRTIAVVTEEFDGAVASTGFCVLRPSRHLDPAYLFYALCDEDLQQRIEAKARGISYPAVRNDDVLEESIRVPPRPVQEQIARLVSERFAEIAAGSDELSSTAELLVPLRAALLSEAFSEEWPRVPLIEALHSLRNGIFVSRPGETPPGTAIFRISAVRPLTLDVSDVRYASPTVEIDPSFFVNSGDLLFTRYSGNAEYVGACAVVPELPRPTLHPDKLIRAIVNPAVADPHFIALACSTGETLEQIRSRRKTTAGQVGIAGGQLKTVTVPLPPLDVQQRVAAKMMRQLEWLRGAGDEVDDARRIATQLQTEVVRQALSGGLTQRVSFKESGGDVVAAIQADAVDRQPMRRRKRKNRHEAASVS